MKNIVLFSFALLFSITNALAQTKSSDTFNVGDVPKVGQPSITFNVCDVPKVAHQFELVPYKNSVEQRCGTGIEAWSAGKDSLITYEINPFVACVRDAYLNHRELVLSPDMIWLLISQGFAIHVDQNADSLRHYFVDFDGKKVLKVERDDFVKGAADNPWQEVFPAFTKQIGEYTGQELLNTTLVNFSTTGVPEKAAFEVTLMDAMSSYFVYTFYSIGCGIPKVTLEGTPQDWEILRTKALALKKYDLGWWINDLKPVLDQFVNAANGKADRNFWAQIYDINSRTTGGVCGGGTTITEVTGWITKFFPYQKSGGDKYAKRPNLSEKMDPEFFPSGMAKADFYWYYSPDGASATVYQMQFLAGFMGTVIDKSTEALRPEIGWAIRDTGNLGIKDGDEKYEKDIMTPPGN